MKKFIKQIWEYGWARKAFAKLSIAMVLTAIFATLFNITGIFIFLYAMYTLLVYLGIFIVVAMTYAWIINPISWLIKKIKEKKKK